MAVCDCKLKEIRSVPNTHLSEKTICYNCGKKILAEDPFATMCPYSPWKNKWICARCSEFIFDVRNIIDSRLKEIKKENN